MQKTIVTGNGHRYSNCQSLQATIAGTMAAMGGGHTATVMAQGYSCRPCGQKHCMHPDADCMDAIQVDQMMQAFHSLMVKSSR